MKMIVIVNERNGHKVRFKNYQKLYNHLNSYEWSRRYNRPNRIIDDWFFACHSYSRIIAFYEFILTQKANARGRKFPKLDVLEMSYGRFSKPTLVPITPETDVESLQQDWCRTCCEARGYKLVEVQDDDGVLHVKKT